ncbi:MAG: hypothetical protein P8Z30_12000 [Acidobacteriota bacterium]
MTSSRKKTKTHPLLWTVESLLDEPSYLDRAWFGCRAVYLHGLMVLVLCSGEEPWNGLLIPTDHQFHQDIMQDFSGVVQHPVLKKWLYLPENQEDFESTAMDLVEAIRLGYEKLGVELKEKQRRREG